MGMLIFIKKIHNIYQKKREWYEEITYYYFCILLIWMYVNA